MNQFFFQPQSKMTAFSAKTAPWTSPTARCWPPYSGPPGMNLIFLHLISFSRWSPFRRTFRCCSHPLWGHLPHYWGIQQYSRIHWEQSVEVQEERRVGRDASSSAEWGEVLGNCYNSPLQHLSELLRPCKVTALCVLCADSLWRGTYSEPRLNVFLSLIKIIGYYCCEK